MFIVNGKLEVVRLIAKCDCNRYIPPALSIVKGDNSQICSDIPREESVTSLKDSFSGLHFDVLRSTEFGYGDAQDNCLVNLGRNLIFRQYKITTFSGRELETNTNAHKNCVLFKFITSSKSKIDLFIGFHHDSIERVRKFRDCKDKNTTGKFYVMICSQDVFGVAEY